MKSAGQAGDRGKGLAVLGLKPGLGRVSVSQSRGGMAS